MEQVEYSNVIVLNKQDLVSESQIEDILDRMTILNPKANVVMSEHCKIDVMEILNTHRFTPNELGMDSVMSAAIRLIVLIITSNSNMADKYVNFSN